MIKKIIPVIALIGTSALVVGISSPKATIQSENYLNHINSFKNEVATYASLNTSEITKNALNKYSLSIQNDDIDNILTNNIETLEEVDETNQENVANNDVVDLSINSSETESEQSIENINLNEEIAIDNLINEDLEEISTLYSLSNDIEDSCDDFCELKEDIAEAIVETQNLIKKVQEKELELSPEQRLFITEQAQQLKNLGRQLSSVTTELSFNLSDINQIMAANNGNLDNLSMKYLVVLDNLVNGNEMLQSGLSSLNLINQMFNMNTSNIPSNNQGRVLYGFQHNNNPPVVKDYYIDENGNMVENTETNENQETPVVSSNEEEKTNIDTYQNSQLKTNLDTYNNNNLPHNIDSFFNTALLDNNFMYGNGNNGYGVNGLYGMANPYNQGYYYNTNNTTNSDNQNINTQNNAQENKNSTKEKRKNRLKKNIDTYKDENEPDIKTKLGNIKSSISNFFKKFKRSDLDDKIENPVYRTDGENLNKN